MTKKANITVIVDSLSTSLQAKLLRLLQEKEFIRVGGDEFIPVDIRVIAACNKKQSEEPEKNLLRQDLFCRLSTLYLQLPGLLDRKSDIPYSLSLNSSIHTLLSGFFCWKKP